MNLSITLFALPKPMEGEAALLQANAFNSWARLSPNVEVILLGDESGISQAARDYGFGHLPNVQRNRWGTPLLDDAFQQARENSRTWLLGYFNADILLGEDFLGTLEAMARWEKNRFLGIGQRWESQLDTSISQWSNEELKSWMGQLRQSGQRASVVCKDYFLFPRHLYQQIPSFAVGRGNWDNWMVYHAHRSGFPVIDLTDSLTAVHQPHGHGHSGGRKNAYMSGPEARENQRLARGRHLTVGSHASYRMDRDGRVGRMGWRAVGRVIRDAPRFVQLLTTFRNVRDVAESKPGES